ncbi:hypothetical protein K523DRAFT_142596 [Schizophyllum commune Tattone D]|nr:hypothetical protein K523DRAFT_142596 [Schizophyllum commune Tattone D]
MGTSRAMCGPPSATCALFKDVCHPASRAQDGTRLPLVALDAARVASASCTSWSVIRPPRIKYSSFATGQRLARARCSQSRPHRGACWCVGEARADHANMDI